MVITSNDYVVVLKQKYELAKNGIYGGFLLEPSSAQLRELCLLVFDKGLKKKDEEVFANFFKPKEEKGLRKSIENVDVEKLRTVCNFLKGISKKTNLLILNLIAVLVDYEIRPFSQFISNHKVEDVNINNTNTDEIDNEVGIENEQPKEIILEISSTKNLFKKHIGIGALGLLGIFTIGYTTKDILFPEKQCMQWENDHFEMVDCSTKINTIGSFTEIKPYKVEEFNLKRIFPNKSTPFFLNGKPLVWYSKIDSVTINYYNNYGFDPKTGKPLKPITEYIIEKYIK